MDKLSLISFINKNYPVSREVLETIVSHFEVNNLIKNELFLREGKVSNNYLFLEEGFMRTFTYDFNGNEVTTYFYPKNRVVFDAASFFMRTVSTENIQALTDCKGFSITYDKLNMLFHSIPEFREFGRSMLVKEFVLFKQRTLAAINQTAEERYAALIGSNSEIFRYAQLKHIASYLGITDSSLSRIRREYAGK